MTSSVNTKRVILKDVAGNYLIPYTDGSAIGSFSYDELTDKPSINNVTLSGNKTSSDLGLMSDANFIPADTTITVKTDGTGDFTDIQSAIDYLTGKYSNGKVTISISAGTYSLTSSIAISSSNFNIPELQLFGSGKTNTIINASDMNGFNISNSSTKIRVKDLKVVGSTNTQYSSIKISDQSKNVRVENVELTGNNIGINVATGSNAWCPNCTISDTNYASFYCATTSNMYIYNATCSNSANGVVLYMGGIATIEGTFSTTNVTNGTAQTVNTITVNGIIFK